MKREGRELKNLADGHPRRLADGRNAWRKMTPAQRSEFLEWAFGEALPIDPALGMEITREGRRR